MTTPRTLIVGMLGIALLSSCEIAEDGDATAGTQSDAPSVTVAAAPVSVLVDSYEAETLDGQLITIRAGDGSLSSFTEGVPSVMHSIQLLAEQGDCGEIQSTGDFWASQADETDEGLKASAFAKKAYDVHAFIQCSTTVEPVATPAPAPAPEPEIPTDPQFRTCGAANDAGFGDYVQNVDPEYDWYDDRDNDGIVCERTG